MFGDTISLQGAPLDGPIVGRGTVPNLTAALQVELADNVAIGTARI